jgi:hypothetical protein
MWDFMRRGHKNKSKLKVKWLKTFYKFLQKLTYKNSFSPFLDAIGLQKGKKLERSVFYKVSARIITP